MRIKHTPTYRVTLPRYSSRGDKWQSSACAEVRSKEVSPKALRYCWHRPVRRRGHWSTCVKGECLKLARSRHKTASAVPSLLGGKRTSSARYEHFRF